MKITIFVLLSLFVGVYCQTRVGTVFSQTNEIQNRLAAYPRFSDGSLGSPTIVLTGGQGIGLSPLANPAGPADPFFTQNSVIRNNAGTRVYCVNAGSNSVSSFIVDNTGTVQLEHVWDSGGEFPATLAISNDDQTLYVVNIGALGRLVSIPLRSSARSVYVTKINGAVNLYQSSQKFPQPYPLLSTPGDVVVSPDGRYVLVTDKGHSTITAYRTAGGGRLLPSQKSAPVVWTNTHNHSWPLYWVNPTTLLVGSFGPNPTDPTAPNFPSFVNVLNWDASTAALTSVSELGYNTTALCWFSKAAGFYYIGSLTQFLPAFTIDPSTRQATAINAAGLAEGHAFDSPIGYFDQYGIDGVLYNLGYLDAVPHIVYAFGVNADGSVTIISQNGEAPVSQGMTAI